MPYVAFISKTGTVHLARDGGATPYDVYSLCGRLLERPADRHGAEGAILDELAGGIPQREKPLPGVRVDLADLPERHPEARLCRQCSELRVESEPVSRLEPSGAVAVLRQVEEAAERAADELRAQGVTDPHIHASLRIVADLMRLHEARLDGADEIERPRHL
jgi:hypothetical protein